MEARIMVLHNMLQITRVITAGTFEFTIHPTVGSHVGLQVGRNRSWKCAFRAWVPSFGPFGSPGLLRIIYCFVFKIPFGRVREYKIVRLGGLFFFHFKIINCYKPSISKNIWYFVGICHLMLFTSALPSSHFPCFLLSRRRCQLALNNFCEHRSRWIYFYFINIYLVIWRHKWFM